MPTQNNWIASRLVRQNALNSIDYGGFRARRRFDINNQEKLVNDLTAQFSGGNASLQKALGQHLGLVVDDRVSSTRLSGTDSGTRQGAFEPKKAALGREGASVDPKKVDNKDGGAGPDKPTITVGGQDAISALNQASANNRTGTTQVRPE